ncbi:MAG: ATP-grasp fold amidoligase family protein [Eubacteriales bacterium]
MSRLKKIIKNPKLILVYCAKICPRLVSKRMYIKITYEYVFKKKINLSNPKTFNEKLQWLKLNDFRAEYTSLVDKAEVKKIVADKVGDKYIIPTIGVWEKFEDIDFNKLPNQFVLKCTHDSGSVVICKNKKNFDKDAAKKKLNQALKQNFYYRCREYPYKNVKPRIIAEDYINDISTGQLYDYKIFCFNGVPQYFYIASDRHLGSKNTKFDYFDIEFNRIDMRQAQNHCSNTLFFRPKCYDKMIEIASVLSKGIPQVRVDFYIANDKLIFGELTFFHQGGFGPFIPEKFDDIWGEKIKLPNGE